MLFQCATQKKVTYDFPAEMKEPVRLGFTEQCDKGQILYDINCGKCHTKIVKRKKIVPDFTLEQIETYQIRIANPQHESKMTEEIVSGEELGLIITFLTYKTKNTVKK